MDDRFRGLMNDAARLTREGRLDEATRAIQRALATGRDDRPAATATGEVLDGLVTEVATEDRAAIPPPAHARAEPPTPPQAPPTAPTGPASDAGTSGGGDASGFLAGRHALGSMARDYRLYVPPGASGRGAPLVVMLHGCTQDAADFAAGTRMNELARDQGFLVLYPEQATGANPQRCWNWFKHTHQQRGRGEPALIASLTRQVVQRHGVDPARVYVAGLSAGAAMAAVVAARHPDLFAAVGVHSGLAPGIATDLPAALAAMQGTPAMPARTPDRPGAASPIALEVPTIVFHGDQDRTVHPRNAEQVIRSVVRDRSRPERVRVEPGASARGRRHTRTVYDGGGSHPDAELWMLHGAGHAWSGGSAGGSYTDAHGTDATGEMLRFFADHRGTVRPTA